MGIIRKSFAHLDTKLLRSLNVTFIRPLLEFAVPACSPALKCDIDLLERVQHRAIRLIPSLRSLNYEERLKALDIIETIDRSLKTTLSERRRRGDMIQILKIFHGYKIFH